ncbi:MAG: DUF2007 domain-containing protein [Gammaproteobacteria bacterium]|nr:DUF2007 domain-containing protein [Gammaproteobacteria bacterium]
MIRVFTADNRALAWHIKNILQSNSIEAEVRNDTLHSAQGGIPLNECNPEVWVVREADEQQALQLIDENSGIDLESAPPPWKCGSCGEQNLGQFDICWNCQAAYN